MSIAKIGPTAIADIANVGPVAKADIGEIGGEPVVAPTWSANNAQLSPHDGTMVAYWKGANLLDSSGNNHTWTDNGTITFTAGISGDAFTLNGSDQWGSIANHADWDIGTGGGDFTLNAWTNFSAFPSYAFILSFGGYGVVTTDYDGWCFLDRDATNDLFFAPKSGGSGYAESWNPPTSTNFMVTAARRSGTVHLYVDGSELGSGGAVSITDTTNSLLLGRSADGGGYFPGQLSHIMINKGFGFLDADVAAAWNGGTGAFLL